MILEPLWASPCPGDSGPHLDVTCTRCFRYGSRPQPDLVTLVLNWASPGSSEYAPSGPHLDLVTLDPNWASSGHGSTAWLQVGLTWSWYLWSLPGYQRDMVPLHGLHVGLTWN